MRITSSPSPVIRARSWLSAGGSGSSARKVVVSGSVVIWQSSNAAASMGPAHPAKVISYVLAHQMWSRAAALPPWQPSAATSDRYHPAGGDARRSPWIRQQDLARRISMMCAPKIGRAHV